MSTGLKTIRPLNQEEQNKFSAGVVYAVNFVPAFRDAIALLRPFYDGTAETAYTDKYARVGLSPWFFTLNTYQQASILLHETMHVLNNHFVREESMNIHPRIGNIAGDFEINSGLDMLPEIDLSFAIFPDKEPFHYKRNMSLEQYAHLIKEDANNGKFGDGTDPNCPQHGKSSESNSGESGGGQGSADSGDGQGSADSEQAPDSSGNGSAGSNDETDSKSSSNESNRSSGSNGSAGEHSQGGSCTCPTEGIPIDSNTKMCDDASDGRSSAADEAGISRASDAEQSIAKKNTTARVIEDLKHGRKPGKESLHDFLTLAQRLMQPPKVKWQSMFKREVSKINDAVSRGRADYSYRRVNRRASHSSYIFPGMVQYKPTAMLGIDASASMGNPDYNRVFNEVEGIIKALGKGKDFLKVFFIDTKIGDIKPVSSVKHLKITGGGGTDMSVGVHYVNELKPKEKPDVFVLMTDGYTDWDIYEKRVKESNRKYNHILLITQKGGYETVPTSLKRLITVIDISEER